MRRYAPLVGVFLSAVTAVVFSTFGVLFLVASAPAYAPHILGSFMLAACGVVSLSVGIAFAKLAGKLAS